MKEKKQSLKSKVTYVKKNWMLYIFFLMPALLLTGLQCNKGCAGESMGRA